MTVEEARADLMLAQADVSYRPKDDSIDIAIKALEQEPRKDEVILTNKEYRELVSNEYENGYAKGYREALEQDKLLDYVTESIEAEKKMIGSCHDLASEDYHKGIIYAFECMKMKLM